MNEFIEKNKGLLNFYAVIAQSTAVLILILTPLFIMVKIFSDGQFSDVRGWSELIHLLLHLLLNYIIPGSLALLVAQFIRCLTKTYYKPGWILRHGTAVLYLCALLVVVSSIWQWIFFAIIIKHSVLDTFSTLPPKLLSVFVSLFLTAAKVLILVGLGEILRRVMPVIEESKTLV